MQRVSSRRRDHHLGVTGQLDLPALARAVGDAHPAQFDIVLGRDHDVGMGLDLPAIRAAAYGVATAKLGAPLGENRLEALRALEGRLMGSRPERPTGNIAQVTEAAPVVAGPILAPAGDGKALPAAVATARVADHDVVAAVREQLHLRQRRVGSAKYADRYLRGDRRGAHLGQLRRVRKQGGRLRNPLLEQQQHRLEHRLRHEAPLHRPVQQQIGQCQQAHALVMGHERAQQRARLPAPLAGRRVVDGLEEAEPAQRPFGGEALQIQAGRLGRHHQRHHRGIGRDHQILGQAALESQARHAEGAVLVIELGVDRVVAGFRHAPGHAALLAVLDLSRHRRLAGLVEQRVLVARHHQQRHQVLEHRAAPGQQRRCAGGAGQQAAQGEPAVLRQLTLGDGDEAAQARFGRQQIVVARIQPALIDVVADGQQIARLVEQEVVVQAREFAGLQRQGFDGGDALAGPLAALPDAAKRSSEFLALRSVGRSGDARRETPIQSGEFAQGRNGLDLHPRLIRHTVASGRHATGHLRQRQPGRKEHQLVQRRSALSGQHLGPAARFIVGRSSVGRSIAAALATAGERRGARRQAFETGPHRRQGPRRGGAEGLQFPA